jgi:hypothetical protein
MSYVVQRIDGLYVAPHGSERSYTRFLQLAQVYSTREQALADKCGNEVVLSLEEAMLTRGQ